MEIRPTKTTTQILTMVINDHPNAYSYIMGEEIWGTVCFYNYQSGVIMIYEINGLPKSKRDEGGIFGFHIHEGETCQNDTSIPYEKTKGHFNPDNAKHPYHLGDLPPLFATNGKAWGMLDIDKLKIRDIIDKTIVIHEHPDDFHTQPAGHSGMKIACGEIHRFL